jgi:uncharacterized protein YqjF (DUF2071 family)
MQAWIEMTDPRLTLALREMPATRVAMTMNWRDLLFLHYSCDPGPIQDMLPPGLTVDTFPDASGTERAWIGLVPFRMEAVCPNGMPRIRPCADFPETNVRTYCHFEGRDPGVWFFSLDAANPVACAYARLRYRLNYREATMSVDKSGDIIRYVSKRWRRPLGSNRVDCELGPELGPATPGTLEFFLIERYLLYSYKKGQLFKGQVFHPPYELRSVESFAASSGLIEANGLDGQAFSHAIFSDGVDVQAGAVVRVA